MKNKKNVPDIRFKGFTDEWKEQRLGDCADIIGGGTPDTSNREYWNGDIDWYSPAEIGDKVFVDGSKRKITELGLKESSAKILPIGTVLFSSRAGIGSTAILAKKGATNQGFQSIIPHNGKLDTYFIFSRTRELKKYGETNGAGSTFIEISGKQMESMPIINPEIDEQQAIGNYFQNIDRLINTSQTKLDKLRNIKKACLEKMFPRNGSTTPELRFKGFSEEWKICELKDICVIKTGYPFNSMDFSDDGDFRVITNGNIQDNSAIVDNLSGNKVNIYNKQIIEEYGLNIGDVLVTMDGTVGRSAKVADYYMVLAQRVGRLIAMNNTEFLYQLLNASSFYKEMTAISVGGTIKHISLSDIGSYSTSIPTDVNEQIQLGIFFRNLDDLVAKTEQQINKLKNIKKACLDKMFVNE